MFVKPEIIVEWRKVRSESASGSEEESELRETQVREEHG